MKELYKWQAISFFSRSIAMVLGLVQSFFIVRYLSVSEYGIVQLAVAIGGAFGIYQHLGLASGSTREIAAAKDDTEVFKIFTMAALIRYSVTLPIALGLFYFSESIALSSYEEPAILLPLKIYSVVLLFQGVQSMLNSVISGTKRFKHLFIYQSSIALVSVALYIPLVYVYRINGFFYALLAFNIVASIVLSLIAFIPLKGKLQFPSKSDFKRLLKELLSISLAIYFVKVIFTLWEKSGPILLGMEVSTEVIGIFSFALLFAKKLMHVSDSVTDVNLPVLSDKYVNDFDKFRKLFSENFDKIYAFLVFSAVSAIFWSKELILLVIGSDKYNDAFPLILPMVFTFIFYALVNIIKSSVIVPAKMIKELIFGFVLLIGVTILFYFSVGSLIGFLNAMVLGLMFGAMASFIFFILASQQKLQFVYFRSSHFSLIVLGFVFAYLKFLDVLAIKIGVFGLFALVYVLLTFAYGYVKKSQVIQLINMVKARLT